MDTGYRQVTTFRLGREILQAMDRLFERDGISPSEQARRALAAFLTAKGVYKAPARKRGAR